MLAKDDFMLLRKNVTLEHLFNITFMFTVFGLFIGRIGYIIEHPSTDYINPLVFLLFPYFPGISLSFALAGVATFIWWNTKRKKLPFGRMFDVYTLAFLPVFAVGMFIEGIVAIIFKQQFLPLIIGAVVVCILSILCYHFFQKNKFQDGNIGFLGLSIFAFIHLIMRIFQRGIMHSMQVSIEDICLFVIFVSFLCICLKQEKIFKKVQKR